jgi:internalin A
VSKRLKVILAFFILTFIVYIAYIISYIVFGIYGYPYPENPDSLFPNYYLEKAVREQLNKPTGELTKEDCLGITELDLHSSDYSVNLEGIQHFVDLEKLSCGGGRLKDLSALKGLIKLKDLNLMNNDIEDLSPLKDLVNLEHLELLSNRVKDVSALQNLVSLKYLGIRKNPVKNFDVLSALPELMIDKSTDVDYSLPKRKYVQ